MPPRKNRRMRRKGRKGRKNRSGVPKGALKQYTYNFRLDDQHMFSESGGAPTALYVQCQGGIGPLTIASSSPTAPTPGANWNPQVNTIYATNNLVSIGGNLTFSINDLKNWTPFKSLYDNYRLNYITVSVELLNNTSQVSSGGLMPTVYMFLDQDGLSGPGPVTTPTAGSDLTDRQGVRKFTFTSSKTRFSMRIKPKLSNEVIAPGGSTTAYTQTNGWLDIQNTAGEYYGLLFWVEDWLANGVALNALRWSFTYNISLKGALNLH